MKRLLAATVVLLLACPGALAAQPTALETFEALLSQPVAREDATAPADDCLEAVMAGTYAGTPQTDAEAEAYAGQLDALCRVTNRDLASYASAHQMKMAQIRNAWYKALANAVRAEIGLRPDDQGAREDALRLIAVFLSAGQEADKAEIRGQMTPQASARIAERSGLPEAFVTFLIMDPSWDDDSWENDDDWRAAARWGADGGVAFEDVIIGARDSAGTTLIADMQEILIANGYLKGKADGIFGPRTQAALLEFQLANGCAPTGVYDVAAYDLLRSDDLVARWEYDGDFRDTTDFASPDTADSGSARGISVGRGTETSTRDSADTPDTPEDKKPSVGGNQARDWDSEDSDDD